MFFESKLEQSANAAWELVRRSAGLPEGEWKLKLLSKRDEKNLASVSYLAENGSGLKLVFRHRLRPHSPERFEAHFDRQVDTFRVFPHSDKHTSPKPIFLDRENQASLLTFCDGQAMAEVMRDAHNMPHKQFELLRRAGEWLDAFHRCQFKEYRSFRPKHTVKYYQNIRDQILSREIAVAAEPLYLKGIEFISKSASKYAKRETVSAQQHGDFHMRNLIVSDQQIAGIDVSKSRAAPVGHDIAKILLDYTAIMRSADDLRPGAVVPDDALEAFFSGYSLVNQTDPSVNFLLYVRVLATLLQVPKNRLDRKPARQRTLKRLRPIAENAFIGPLEN